MEKITLYEAVVEFEHKSICQEVESEKSWWSIGLFKNEQDAKHAIQIYEKANKIKGNDCTGNHYVTSNSYPKHLNPRYYTNLDEFINNNVPVIPFFITMEDSDVLDADGFFVQEYTVNILPAIYPDKNKSRNENMEYMKNENYNAWKKTYESFYNKKLEYEK